MRKRKRTPGRTLPDMTPGQWKKHISENPNPEDLGYENLGPLMAAYRKERGLTQRELAEKLGISHVIVSKIESCSMSDRKNTYTSVFFTILLFKWMTEGQ